MNERESQKTVFEVLEKEILTRTTGEYFGEWGIIEGSTRRASAYTLEDTELFILDAEAFTGSFGRCMIRAENDRKNFLMGVLKPLVDLPRAKFNSLYKSMFVKFLIKNEIVYIEGNNAEMFYIIYDGVFRMQKKNMTKEEENEEMLKSEVTKHHTVIKLSIGDIAGTEAFDNFSRKVVKSDNDPDQENSVTRTFDSAKIPNYSQNNKSEDSNNLTGLNMIKLMNSNKVKYKYSLVAENEYNVIIAINPRMFGPELRESIYKSLIPVMEKKKNILDNILKSYSNIKRRMKITFREEIIQQLSKNHKNFTQKNFDRNLETIKEEIRLKNFNSLLTSYNVHSNFRLSENKKEILEHGPDAILDLYRCSSGYSTPSQTDRTYNGNKTESQPSEYFNTEGSTRMNTDRSSGIKKLSVLGRNSHQNSHIKNIKAIKDAKFSIISDDELNKLINANVNRLSVPLMPTEINDGGFLVRRDHNIFNTYKTVRTKIATVNDTSKDKKPKCTVILNKYVSRSADMWKKHKKVTDTGNFNFPLITQLPLANNHR